MDLASQTLILFRSLVSTARMRITIHSSYTLTYINVLFLTHTIHSILLQIFFFSLAVSFSSSSIDQVVESLFLYYKNSTSALGRITNVYFSAILESVLNKRGVQEKP